MAMLHIISKLKIQLPTDEPPPPGSTIQLSLFDIQFVEFPIVKTVLLYPNATVLPSSFSSFKSSIALTLPHFHPLGGDLTYLPSSDDVAIICSKDSGVVVIEAKSDLDINHLFDGRTLDGESLLMLVPNNSTHESPLRASPLPVLSVQFTVFSGGGIAVGIACHHAAMDGWGLWQFIHSWALTCRDGAVPPGLVTVHNRSIISDPYKNDIKKQMLNLYAPNLSKINPNANHSIQDHIVRSTRMLFTVDLSSIQLLKQRATGETPLTTFQVLAAHFWISVARAKGLTSNELAPTILIFPMDCRALLNPPVGTEYTGNCVRSIFVESNGASLMAPDGLAKTSASIAKSISIVKEQPLEGTNTNDPLYDIRSFNGLKVVLSGSPKMQVYDVDFGWGKPSWHAIVSMNCDGVGIIISGRQEGTVHLQVSLMGGIEEFVRAFDGGFDHC